MILEGYARYRTILNLDRQALVREQGPGHARYGVSRKGARPLHCSLPDLVRLLEQVGLVSTAGTPLRAGARGVPAVFLRAMLHGSSCTLHHLLAVLELGVESCKLEDLYQILLSLHLECLALLLFLFLFSFFLFL